MNYPRKIASAIGWSAILKIFFRSAAFIKVAVLARILTPEQFGIFGVVVLTLALLEMITETGINPFLVVEEKVEEYLDTAWVISIIRGTAISLLLFLLASPISAFFKSPEALPLLQIACLTPLIRGFINPACVLLIKKMNFKAEFFYRSAITFIEVLLAIIISVSLKSPLGLVLAVIGSAIWEVASSFYFISLRPRLNLDILKVKRIMSRGKWVTGFGILEYLFTNIDNIVVGRLLGTSGLGLYQNAYKISTLPLGEVNDVLYKTSLPLYSHMLISGRLRLKPTILLMTSASVIVLLTLGVVIYVFSEAIVLILLGPAWTEIIPTVKTLAFLGVIKGTAYSFNSVFMSKKKQHHVTVISFTSVLGLAATIVPLVNSFGILGAGIAALIGSALSLPVALYFISKELKTYN